MNKSLYQETFIFIVLKKIGNNIQRGRQSIKQVCSTYFILETDVTAVREKGFKFQIIDWALNEKGFVSTHLKVFSSKICFNLDSSGAIFFLFSSFHQSLFLFSFSILSFLSLLSSDYVTSAPTCDHSFSWKVRQNFQPMWVDFMTSTGNNNLSLL